MDRIQVRKANRADDIAAIENEYRTVYFRMALSHLFDAGFQQMTPENVEETKRQILSKAAHAESIPVMTPEFQCALLDISLALTAFSIWELLSYVKTDLVIG